ncbi:MAG: aminoacyl-tRNA hydrolase [Sulfurimonas sp. RIFCSPHIGHO2_12_FULL_36_9]|jgi:PTH1 family peptidyl-tRNA hydrolase|uniref:aminoacyl-tRNA hydrolase n=1 Tax=Sulfurimonas sp. RIFCSPLOWO2_12_36_12 TaxID=1802253 RepID=UPI0008B5C73F|nr:aminoacyl-tRNA hydrolase [Sulfurimonas sp. RIFCSPLOWO2_12_36_12]OHD96903.1 MAG: aminoacyl-tRNA hydrolase [Sulfurimonas sp. RIFCSPHIGHO2_12_FULL_36_9]OHE00572.1 MAG: aminoacyl-tRNA hydrolase [Sulfurimonas sp. RIFCSPLOWO2_02_FULL_36_28]OHE01213.1 MAG: aminoacyl-tRNA hydrolase [Sulfurimonas sp. RIFCSPLOWO2_12_36_12]OHE03834.1 MAG: aminoacyl-tRNA hydrolase [Sulfurimonas sp. RIFCSPLOWO2_12_FULL_36_74]
MLIVGLGNPGPSYEQTRHNIGFMVIDELLRRQNAQKLSSSSFNGELFKFSNHFLLKPLTFMNLSGTSILAVKKFYKIDEVVVIHDDLDLPFGTLRFKKGGGHGGHNGLKSTDENISKEYIRVRMGIGKPEHKGEVASYVLSNFNEDEQKHLKEWVSFACEAVEYLLGNSLEDVSSKYTIKKFQLK